MKIDRAVRAALTKQGVLPLTPVEGFEGSLIELVAGAKIKGSWWSHPKGQEIFRVASALEDDAEVLACKLVAGKVTYVDRALFGPLYRIVIDAAWKRRALDALPSDARAIYEALPARKAITIAAIAEARGVKPKTLAKAREALEKSMVVRSASEHTERGHHETMLEPWSVWASADVKGAAKALSISDAAQWIRAAIGDARCPLVREGT